MATRLKKALLTTAITGAGLLLSAGPAAATPVPLVNPGFETPDVSTTPSHPNQGGGTAYRFDVTNANSPDLTGWQIVAGNIDILRSFWQPAQGAQSVDLYGCQPAVIRQKVATVAGGQYTLRFAKAGNVYTGGVRLAQVSAIDSVTSATLATKLATFDTTGRSTADMG